MKTHASEILASLIAAGFVVDKNEREGMWQVKDGDEVLFRSRSLGDVLHTSAKELGV